MGGRLIGIELESPVEGADRLVEIAADDQLAAVQEVIERGRRPECPGGLNLAVPAREVARAVEAVGAAEVVRAVNCGRSWTARSRIRRPSAGAAAACDRISSKS